MLLSGQVDDESDPGTGMPAAAGKHALDKHRAERHKRIVWSMATAVVTKPLAVLTPVIIVPLFVQYLGVVRYGLYESIGALAAWLTLTNIGLGLGLVNKLMDCHVAGDRLLARCYVTSAMVGSLLIAVLGAVVFSIVVLSANWGLLFPVADPAVAREVVMAIWAAGLIALVGVVLTVPVAVYTAHQDLHRANAWDLAARLVTLAACVLVVRTDLGLVGVILAAAGAALLVRLFNLMAMFGLEKRWLCPHPRYFDPRLLKAIIVPGLGFFCLQAGLIVIYQSDKLVISALVGPADVAPYGIAGRATLLIYGLFILILTPLWGAHGEALRRGDLEWVRRVLRTTLLVGCGMVLCLGVVLLVWRGPIFQVWTRGAELTISPGLLLAFMSMFCLRAWVDARSIVLNAAGVLGPQVVVFMTHAALNLVLSVLLAPRFGAEGVAWATSITALLTSFWAYPLLIRRHIWSRPHAPAARD